MKFVHIGSANPKFLDINIKREENSDPLALSNNFDTQAHIDSQQEYEHLAGDLKPEDCDVQIKIEVQEHEQDFTMDSVDKVDSMDESRSSGEKYLLQVSVVDPCNFYTAPDPFRENTDLDPDPAPDSTKNRKKITSFI